MSRWMIDQCVLIGRLGIFFRKGVIDRIQRLTAAAVVLNDFAVFHYQNAIVELRIIGLPRREIGADHPAIDDIAIGPARKAQLRLSAARIGYGNEADRPAAALERFEAGDLNALVRDAMQAAARRADTLGQELMDDTRR